MKTFHHFIVEASWKRRGPSKDRSNNPSDFDPEIHGGHRITSPNVGGRVGSDRRKTKPEKRRVKAAGGGTTEPAKDYKDRKDIGTNKPRSQREQQPTQARGTAGVSGKAAQKKAYLERKARERGEKTPTKTELLSKKTTKTDPNYKPRKASGLTTKERKALYKKGERTLRDIILKSTGKKKESELKHKITSK